MCEFLSEKDTRGLQDQIIVVLELTQVLLRSVFSGSEFQRFVISIILVQEIDIYFFEEAPSYMDVKQLLTMTTLSLEVFVSITLPERGMWTESSWHRQGFVDEMSQSGSLVNLSKLTSYKDGLIK